jgi:hypothetical protein
MKRADTIEAILANMPKDRYVQFYEEHGHGRVRPGPFDELAALATDKDHYHVIGVFAEHFKEWQFLLERYTPSELRLLRFGGVFFAIVSVPIDKKDLCHQLSFGCRIGIVSGVPQDFPVPRGETTATVIDPSSPQHFSVMP